MHAIYNVGFAVTYWLQQLCWYLCVYLLLIQRNDTDDREKHSYLLAVSGVVCVVPSPSPPPVSCWGRACSFPHALLNSTALIVEQTSSTFQSLELDVVAMDRTPLFFGL